MYTKEDIIKAIMAINDEVTDDCTWAGVMILATTLLNMEEEEINNILNTGF